MRYHTKWHHPEEKEPELLQVVLVMTKRGDCYVARYTETPFGKCWQATGPIIDPARDKINDVEWWAKIKVPL